MNSGPLHHYFDTRAAALCIVAMRNEAFSLDALNRYDDASTLRAEADRLQRRTFSVRPVAYKPAPIDIVLEPSPGVSAVVAEYRGEQA